MAGTNNFLQFNPAKTNQSTDANYQSSTYRSGGIPVVPGAAPSTIHNKLYYQVSIMATAIAQMLANRNYNVSDAVLNDLVAVLDTLADKNTVLPLSGGTMTGQIVLSGNPITNLHASPKQYVDTKVPLAGGTMTGPLILSRNPVLPLEAAPKQYVDALDLLPTGAIFWFARNTPPAKFVVANGQLLSRTTYANLWAEAQNFLISDTAWSAGKYGYYSTGDGANTFRVPNLLDRTMVGGGSTFALGSAGGEINHTLLTTEAPVHNHAGSVTSAGGTHVHNYTVATVADGNTGLPAVFNVGGTGPTAHPAAYPTNEGNSSHTHTVSVANSGGGQAHNNMQPYVGLLPCIKF